MHAGAAYDGHRIISWQQLPFNGHHVPSEPQSGVGHLPYMSQASAQQVPNSHQQSFGQPPQQFPRSGVNGGIFPSPTFSTSGQVMSPPSHGGLMSAASHPGSMEHHSPNSGYTTPHDVYTTPPPSQPPHTPAKSKCCLVWFLEKIHISRKSLIQSWLRDMNTQLTYIL